MSYPMQIVCNACHGTGQLRYFKGESRFVLSHDECPACSGLGFIEVPESDPHEGHTAPSVDPSDPQHRDEAQ